MATKEKKQPKKREVKEQVQVEHTGKDLPIPPPRLRVYYEATVRERLKSQFGFTNVHQIPTLEKIVLNCGVGEAIKNAKVLDTVVNELAIITGQRPVMIESSLTTVSRTFAFLIASPTPQLSTIFWSVGI